MFQHVIEYSVHMTNILLRLSDLEIKNKHIIEEKDIFVQNLQGALEKEQKFKEKLQDKNSENSHVLVEFHATRQKINNMEKQKKYLENIRIERDSLQEILKEIDANCWGLKTKKGTLSVEHSKCRNPSLGLTTKARVCKDVSQE